MDLNSLIQIEETKASLVTKLEWLKNGGLDEYLNHAISEFGIKRLPAKTQHNIIEQILPKSPNDFNVKVENRGYYIAHLGCIKHVWDEMLLNEPFLQNLRNYQVEKGKDMVVYNYYNLIRDFLFDMALLIQDYNVNIEGKVSTKFKLTRNRYQRDFTLYQLLPQVIFGQVSYHAFIEKEPNISIAIIRQIIELRIRSAFGIMGTYDKIKDSFEPLPLSQIFDELKKHKAEIDFAIPLANIIRINGWSNIFMHSGMKDYTWTLIFVYRYLHEFAKGREIDGIWSSNSGIRLTQQTLEKIISGVEANLKEYNRNLELYKSKPDVDIISAVINPF